MSVASSWRTGELEPFAYRATRRGVPSAVAQSRPDAPVRSGSEPWTLAPGIRSLVNWTRAVTPGTAGAVSASWMATGNLFGGGFGPPPVAAIATTVAPMTRTTTDAQR